MKNPSEMAQRAPGSPDSGNIENAGEKNEMVPISQVEAFYNSTFLKLHVEGKLTLNEERTGPVSCEDPSLAEFIKKYSAKNWPLFLRMALHPEMTKEWTADSYNSIDNTYPRVFAYRQFSGETPYLFRSQDTHAGIPIDDVSVNSLPDTIENLFERNRLTEGDIESNFFLKSIPPHKRVDLRDYNVAIESLGPAFTKIPENEEMLKQMLSKSQFDETEIEKIKSIIQEDEILRKEIALIIINDDSAIVLDPDYLIDIETKKKSLKTENLGHTPIPEKILKADIFFSKNEVPVDANSYLKELMTMYNLYGTHFTSLQEKELNHAFVDFVENRNGLMYNRVFKAMLEKLSPLKNMPTEKVNDQQKDLLQKADELSKKAIEQFKVWKKAEEEMRLEEKMDELNENDIEYMEMQAYKEPLQELIGELERIQS